MTKTFYRVYRPQKFGELVGQKLIRLTLRQSIKENRISHAYLFTGPRGTGKTTTARIFSKAINCLTPLEKRPNAEPCNKCQSCDGINSNKTLDITEIDAASYTGVDNIRQLTENIEISPAELRYRVFIIDEVHMLSKGAFNALLKTLEEPPAHTIFILATTEQHKVPLTIASRCQRFSFHLLTLPEILKKLSRIAQNESIDIDEDSLEMISEAAHGGMRDAESLFAQVVSLAGKKIKADETKEILGISGREDEIELLNHLFEKKIDRVLNDVEEMAKAGMDIFLLSHRVLDYLRKIIFLKLNPRGAIVIEKEISESQVQKLELLAKKISVGELLDLTAKIVQSQPGIKNASLSHLPLELAMAEWGMKDSEHWTVANNSNTTKVNTGVVIPTEPRSSRPAYRQAGRAGEAEESLKQSDRIGVDNSRDPSTSVAKSTSTRDDKKKKGVKSKKKIIIPLSTDLKTVLSKWTAVLQNIRELQPALFSLLKVCSPVKIEDDTLIISTPFKFHKDKLNDGKNRRIFCQELDREVGINRICVVQDASLPKNKVDDDEMLNQVKSLLAS